MRFKKISSSHNFREIELKKGFLDGKNVMLTENGIASRPGVKLLDNPVVFDPNSYSAELPEFLLTNITVNINDEKCRIAVTIESDGKSNVYYLFSALSANGQTSLGSIIFTRTSSESFPLPSSFIIFEGKPVRGSGIYFMARVTVSDEPAFCRIYELSEDKDQWLIISDNEFYVPTLLKNGRGFSATKAISEDGLKLSSPSEPESMNLLSQRYRACYTTDGHSFFFEAPRVPLVGKIECRLLLSSGSSVNWVIDNDKTESEFISVEGVEMRLRCDRQSGRLITDSSERLCIPFPFYGIENNLCFTLSVDQSDALQKVSSLSECRRIFADTKALSGSVTVFSGSELYPEDIVWNSPENPLYFPEKNCLSMSAPVTALSSVGGRLIVFEKDNLSSVKATVKEPLSSEYDPPITLYAERRCELYRRIIRDTIAETDSQIFFCTEDGEVYSADSTANAKRILSLDGFTVLRGVMFGKKYLMINGSTIYQLDTASPRIEKPLLWEMPEEILSAINFSGNTVFYSRTSKDRVLAYTLEGEFDNFSGVDRPIECSFAAKLWDEPARCRLHEISVSGNGKPVEFSLFSGEDEIYKFPFNENPEKVSLSAVFRPLSVMFRFSGGAEFSKTGIKFSRFSKL